MQNSTSNPQVHLACRYERCMMDKEKVQEAVRNLLIALGEDVTRPGLVETPKRVAGYLEELLEGENYTNKEIADMFRKDFQVSYDSMVIKEGVVA